MKKDLYKDIKQSERQRDKARQLAREEKRFVREPELIEPEPGNNPAGRRLYDS